jgi:hypothetical protein
VLHILHKTSRSREKLLQHGWDSDTWAKTRLVTSCKEWREIIYAFIRNRNLSYPYCRVFRFCFFAPWSSLLWLSSTFCRVSCLLDCFFFQVLPVLNHASPVRLFTISFLMSSCIWSSHLILGLTSSVSLYWSTSGLSSTFMIFLIVCCGSLLWFQALQYLLPRSGPLLRGWLVFWNPLLLFFLVLKCS